ncbi:MAG: hypothetical protein ACO3FI_01635 [Cyclobacteriaceae bacterium]
MTRNIIIYYFPAGMRYASWLFPALAIWLGWNSQLIWSALLLLLFLIIISTRYITVIDPQRKIYSDYVFFLWMKLGLEQNRYESIRGITIGRSSQTQNVRSRVQDRQFKWTAYTATLHFDGGQSLDLVTSVHPNVVKKEAIGYAEFLGTQVLS